MAGVWLEFQRCCRSGKSSRLEVQVERLQERREQLREAFNIKEDPTDSHKIELETGDDGKYLAL